MQEKFSQIVVGSTTDYDKFKFVTENRSIKQRNVENLIKSFKLTGGMLKSKPIIVDRELNIIDGQHRLMACRKMNIPVHYIVTDDNTDNIPIYNTYQNKWGLNDYAQYFAKKGNENYIRLLSVCEKAGVSINGCLEGLGIVTSKTFNAPFKEGRFIFERDVEESVAFIQKIMKLCYVIKGKRNISTKISRAIRVLRKIKTFDLDAFIEKVIRYQGKLYNCTTSDEYIEMFAWINNYKISKNRLSPLEILNAKNS